MPNVPEIPDIRSNNIQTPRLDVPVIRNLEPPPILVPINRKLPIPVVDVPLDGIPQYQPIDVPTTEEFRRMITPQQEPKKEEEFQDKPRALPDTKPLIPQIPVVPTQQETQTIVPPQSQSNLGVPEIQVPFVGPVPIPPKEQVMLAGTTATASVAAAIVGKSMVEWLVKRLQPIINQLFVRAKQLMNRDLTPYETQLLFAAELDKKTLKLLKKEQKVEKLRQKKAFVESLKHPHISLRKEKQD
jgi:hypothetical protein